MRPEIELLLDCARSCRNAERVTRITERIQAGPDWPVVFSLARQHRLTPLLGWQLQLVSSESIPCQVLDQLKSECQASAQRNLLLASELLQLLAAFQQIGVEAMPLKGAVLAYSAYGNLSLRQFIDLDIVIHPAEVLRAKAALIARGYCPTIGLNAQREQAHLQSENHTYNFLHPDSHVAVEVHWAISQRQYSFPLVTEVLLRERQSVPFFGRPVLAPAPELMLLVLCAHGSRHYWERLIWVCDVAELIRSQPQLNWERVWENAGLLRSKRMLLTGLVLAQRLLGTSLQLAMVKRIEADRAAQALATKVEHWLFLDAPGWWVTLQKRLFIMQVREHWRDRFAYFRHLLVWSITPNELDQSFLPLPGACSVLYYLLRPVRLLAKGLGFTRKMHAGTTNATR